METLYVHIGLPMVAETEMCFSRDRHYTNVPLAQGHDGATEKVGEEWMRTEQD